MKIRYAIGLAALMFAGTTAGDVGGNEQDLPDVFCHSEAVRLNVTDQNDWHMHLMGCDNRWGTWEAADGYCAGVALDLVKRGFDGDEFGEFFFAVNDAADLIVGECTLWEDGSWSDPDNLMSL